MKINWKDFGLALVIGLIVCISIALIIISGIFATLMLAILMIGIPLMFYFLRNKSEILEAGLISFLLGVIIYWVDLLLFISIPRNPRDPMILLPNPITTSLSFGIISTMIGLIIWFAVKKLKWEKS